jgi:hypothetical protein
MISNNKGLLVVFDESGITSIWITLSQVKKKEKKQHTFSNFNGVLDCFDMTCCYKLLLRTTENRVLHTSKDVI